MKSIPVTKARQDFFNIVSDTINKNEPVQISTKSGNAVIVSESEWKGIMESLYLLSFPGMKEKLVAGKDTPVSECVPLEEIEWDNIE